MVAVGASALVGGCALITPTAPTPTPRPPIGPLPQIVPPTSFTDWGWPLPYELVSKRSIDWLQQNNWWPVQIGYRPIIAGLNAVFTMMMAYDLPGRRGVQAAFLPTFSTSSFEQAFVADRIQAGSPGDVSLAIFIQLGAPIASVAIRIPNIKTGVVVPIASSLQRIGNLRGSGLTIGIEFDSLAIGYLFASAAVNNLTVNRDFYLRAVELEVQAVWPEGVAAVVPWSPVLDDMVEVQHSGRLIDVAFPYHFECGHFIIRREIVDHAPDVVQALVDSYQEGILLVRYRPSAAVDILRQEPRLQKYSDQFLLQQTIAYNNLYKPTFAYLFQDFWTRESAYLSRLLAQNGQLTAPIDEATWRSILIPDFMDRAYARLGWKIPARPPWLPANWSGTVGQPPYPPYYTVDTLHAPQPWPEPSDLVRPWKFNGTTFYP